MKLLLLLLICCLFVRFSYAQSKLDGRVFENRMNTTLPGIVIENLRSHVSMVTDRDGKFSIEAKVGDLLCFSGMGYQPDTVYLVNLKYKEVYLTLKQNMLKEVKVVTTEASKSSFSVPPITPFGGSTVRYQTDSKGNPRGGLIFNLFGSGGKRDKIQQLEFDQQRQIQIRAVFNPKTLQAYLPIRDQEMENFIILYMPDVKTYFNSNFNLVLYLNASYKEFMKLPVDKRQSKTYFQLSNTDMLQK